MTFPAFIKPAIVAPDRPATGPAEIEEIGGHVADLLDLGDY